MDLSINANQEYITDFMGPTTLPYAFKTNTTLFAHSRS